MEKIESLRDYVSNMEEYQSIQQQAVDKANKLLQASEYNEYKKSSMPFLGLIFKEKIGEQYLFEVSIGREFHGGAEIKLVKSILIQG